ncbi:translation initiation factor IF-2 [Ornithobacterium rhinotracheale]|uniref:translation initiation factor IF-2 n=1 Tax=Ornithobacterium rhinotracheale TaxID=28251 RepID=UPI00129CF480|nr:translation initiation factor IF-2 [Ornithobacterium rhinotracheale]MRJ07385.1 translation initiation factor IF-2 [Ornithobacterium rhinotracheale]UOH77982.1 translation initiation factor IF-2 [Ornithobacterium rhinotracheale]
MPKSYRLNKVIKELNITVSIAADFLSSKGIEIERNPNTKIEQDIYEVLVKKFQADRKLKEASEEVDINKLKRQEQKEREQQRLQEEKKLEAQKKKEAEKLEKEKKKEAEKIAREAEELARLKKEAEQKAEAEKRQAEEPKEKGAVSPEKEDNELFGRKKLTGLKTVGKIDLSDKKPEKSTKKEKPATPAKPKQEKPIAEEKPKSVEKVAEKNEAPVATEEKPANEESEEPKVIETKYKKLEGVTQVGKIDLSKFEDKKKKDKKEDGDKGAKRKRKRIRKNAKPETANNAGGNNSNRGGGNRRGKKPAKKDVSELTEEEVQKQIKETLEKLTNKGNKKTNKGAKHRREKRKFRREQEEQELQQQADDKVLNVTEFVSVNEIASLMDVSVMEIISACMSLGVMVTMNQRLDANTIELVADEFGFDVNFTDAEIEEAIVDVADDSEEDLQPRAPIVTVMGHVDHGKTSLLDYIREENVIAGESGGITQHIGAYAVQLENGKKITFLDTPGHEAFTAMRARGAQITDIAIIVIAADDQIMPQTEEAISHAQAAGVPMIFAINKIDKPTANPDKVKEQLANMNLLVEEWGGKIQSQDISAKTGQNVEELLEKVLLEAEMLELKANPDREASGTVVEAALDKGRGYVSTIVVQNGTLRVGDYVLAGSNHGKVRAMLNERGTNIKEAGPATPVTILGLDGAPTAGDKFRVFEDEREAKQLASKREQLQREQTIRTQKHITLDEIGRRIALGDFQELNIVLKGDVDGSVEALTDSLQKLSTDEIHVNILHKGVGQITESDVLLASASDAVIIGFNVRPNASARNIAEKEEVEIRTYSIIYDAINEVKEAMEGMLSPELKEEIIGNVEIRQTFKISKVGTIAGCMVLDGKITRNSSVRIIRDGVVVHTGELASLKRYKDDVKEVTKGYECGLNIKNYNDIREGDVIEVYVINEVKKKLK